MAMRPRPSEQGRATADHWQSGSSWGSVTATNTDPVIMDMAQALRAALRLRIRIFHVSSSGISYLGADCERRPQHTRVDALGLRHLAEIVEKPMMGVTIGDKIIGSSESS